MKPWCTAFLSLVLCSPVVCLTLSGCGSSTLAASSPAPTVLVVQSISPSSIPAGSVAVVLTVTGSGFTRASLVALNGTELATTFVSSAQLQATIPAATFASGTQLQVTVSDPAASASTTAVQLTVTNPAPVLAGISPSSVTVGSSSPIVTLTGSSFTPSSTVSINGAARTTTYVSDTQLAVALSPADTAALGTLPVTVVNPAPGGGTSSAQPLTILSPSPTLSSISPATVSAGSPNTNVALTGSGFLPSTTVLLNGSPLASVYVSGTQLTVNVSAASLVSGGTDSLVASNAAGSGGVSSAATLTITNPAPTLTAVTPGTINFGKDSTVTLTGTGFNPASIVQWNGAPHAATLLSPTSLQLTLASSELGTAGTGTFAVVNPAPGGGASAVATLNLTSYPIPVIQSVSFALQGGTCPSVLTVVTGTGFLYSASILVNGQANTNPSNVFNNPITGTQQDVATMSFAPFEKPGPITVQVRNYLGNVTSDPYIVPSNTPPAIGACSSPSPATVYPSTTFGFNLTMGVINSSAPTLTLGTLPAGVTRADATDLSQPAYAASLLFTASPTLAPGSYTIPYTLQSDTLTSNGTLAFTVVAGVPPSFFISPYQNVLGIPFGQSRQVTFSTTGSADFAIAPTLSGLPPGVTATFSPAVFFAGQATTATFTASSTAPRTQNATVTVSAAPIGTTAAPATNSLLVDVTEAPGSLPGNRTDFTPTAGTPNSAAYDSAHNQIFSSNPNWNRIDILSAQTHQLTGSINIRDPRGMDLSADGSTLWVSTGSRQVFAIDTSTLAVTRHILPNFAPPSGYNISAWEGDILFAMADGSLVIQNSPYSSGITLVWDPNANTVSVLNNFIGPLFRSGDHKLLYPGYVYPFTCASPVYNATSKTVTTIPNSTTTCVFAAANYDGSILVGKTGTGYSLFSGNGSLIASLPGAATVGGLDYGAGFIFSADGKSLYEIGTTGTYGARVILAWDVSTATLKGSAPALAINPLAGGQPSLSVPLFGVDSSGLIFDIQSFGIGFEDSTFFQNFGTNPVGYGAPISLSPNVGPLAGGTTSYPFGAWYLTPDVWYGSKRGTSATSGTAFSSTLSITSPPGDQAGPVNLKYIFPDGGQMFAPQSFSYSVFPQYATLAGASPVGGAPGQITGYGMPVDASGGTLTVGGNTATITTVQTQYPPRTSEPFPSTYFNFTIPAGTPGWADLQITTPNGSGALPRSIFYAKSVNDYATSDSPTAVLYDRGRRQVYLSAKDHIDVFSMDSLSFLAPLNPKINGSQSQFAGLALTPDGSRLLAANTLDGTLAIINPDSPSTTSAVSLGTFNGTNNCLVGPLYVAATSTGVAFVQTGSLPGTMGCPQQGNLHIVNLSTGAVSLPPGISTCSLYNTYPFTNAFGLESTADGTSVVFGAGDYGTGCLYSAATGTYQGTPGFSYGLGATISADGNLAASGVVLEDPVAALELGRTAHPVAFYGSTLDPNYANTLPTGALYAPQLNASGSLYFWPFPSYFEIIDAPTGRLDIRFSLSEQVQSVLSPLALDGLHDVFLITDKGLTVVDLGTAPLSIGHLTPSTASSGAQIQVRGSGFLAGITAKVGGQIATVSFIDENTVTITLPALSSGSKDLTLTNSDGTSYTLQNAIAVP